MLQIAGLRVLAVDGMIGLGHYASLQIGDLASPRCFLDDLESY